MIFRPSTVLWMVMWVFAAFGLYMVKYKVQAVRTEVAASEKQLHEEKRNLHVLSAEWAYLSRPERLKSLSAKHLNLVPMSGPQLTDIASFPAGVRSKEQLSKDDTRPVGGKGLTLASGVSHDE